MYCRSKDGVHNPAELAGPCIYVEAATYENLSLIRKKITHFDPADRMLKRKPPATIKTYENHDAVHLVFNDGSGIAPCFVLFTHKKAHLFEPSRYLVQQFRSSRHEEFAQRIFERSQQYFDSYDHKLPDWLKLRRYRDESGWGLIEVFVDETRVLLPEQSSLFDATLRYYRRRRTGLRDGNYWVTAVDRNVRNIEGEWQSFREEDLTHVLREGDKLSLHTEGQYCLLPSRTFYRRCKTLEARIELYRAAHRLINDVAELSPQLLRECKEITDLVELEYGDEIKVVLI